MKVHSAPIDARLPVIDLEKPIYVRKPIETHGRSFAPGTVFPWRDLGYRADKVLQLHRDGRLRNAPPKPAPVMAPVAPVLPARPVSTSRAPSKRAGA